MPVLCSSCDRVPAAGVLAGAACPSCGAMLAEDALADPASLSLIALDDRSAASLPAAAPVVRAPMLEVAPPFPTSIAELAPEDELQLEVDPVWTAARVAKQEAARRPPPRPPLRIGGVVLALLLIAGATVAIVMIVRTPPEQVATVTVKLTGPRGAIVLVDGRRVGKLPLTLELPRGRRSVLVTAGTATRQLVPDHDQTVELSP